MITELFSLGKSLVTGWFAGKQEKQKVKQRISEAKALARISRIEANTKADNDLDSLTVAEQKNTWKDEFVVLVFLLPFIGSFIPVVQESVLAGWEYVSKAPDWYNYVIYGIVISVLGLRRMFTAFVTRKTGV